MKNPVLRKRILLGSIPLLFALTIFALPRIAHLQAIDDVPASSTKKAAKEPTGKHVNFEEPRQLDLGANAAPTQPITVVTADFDSDGFADIVTADSAGALQLLKGIDPANFAIDPNAGEAARPEPFSASATGASLGISPDFLFAGDFNADGHPDILGAAKGANVFVIVVGDGQGHFSRPVNIGTGGSITAIESGEIGRADGQADLAVTFSNKNGNFLAVYEHPEGAFKHAPEIIKLPSAPAAIAVGNMDEDFYSDIAVACGPDLVVVHGRGQAYPWDILKDSGISRPVAVVETRRMPFTIAAMTIGRFGANRGTSLAILGGDGNLYALEPTRKTKGLNNMAATRQALNLRSMPFAPTDAGTTKYAMLAARSANLSETVDAMGNPLIDYIEMKAIGRDEYLKKRQAAAAGAAKQLTPDAIARIRAEGAAKAAELNARQKNAFLRSIASKTSPVKDWRLETISAGSQFAAFAAGDQARISRVNVSDSAFDDLMLTQTGGTEIQFISRREDETRQLQAEISIVSAGAGTAKVLPMGLNLDAVDDLVVLGPASAAPSVLMSAPSAVFFVNTTNDSSICVSGGECSLRGAIIEANGNPGNDIIGFALPGGSVISPQSQLPSITGPISMQGYTLPNGTKAIEISGTNAGSPVDGLKIRSSNSFIYNLAINGFDGVIVNGGQVGGNGVVIASDSGAPNVGNNQISNCFLGTDATGNIDRGNEGAGVLIFDSDNNAIAQNLISGNGTGIGVTDGNTNFFASNIIGLNAAGNAKLGNTAGIVLTGSNNTVGGNLPGAGNTVSGNGIPDPNAPGQCVRSHFYFASGIATETLVDLTTGGFLTLNNTIKGNFVGTGIDGTQPLGNCYGGIDTSPLHQTTIGSIDQSGRNIVSDNGLGAIACSEEIFFDVEGGFCAIAGNNIGTDVTGTVQMPNNDRNYEGGVDRGRGTVDIFHNLTVSYFGAPGGNLPNSCTGFCNLYSSNNPGVFEGIYFTGRGAIGIFDNFIGTNQQGNQAFGNTSSSAIEIGNSLNGPVYIGGLGTDENGFPVPLGNLISGNTNTAVAAFTFSTVGSSSSLNVQGNRIGTDASGSFAIPNGNNGIPDNAQPAVAITRGFTETTLIGGPDPLARNIISGNAGDGITIYSGFNSGIFNNLIGVNNSFEPLGNGGNGIGARSSFMQIGGIGGLANHIAYNGTNNAEIHAGVAVLGGGSEPAIGVTIRGNSIHDNNGMAIDLGVRDPRPGFNQFLPDGVTDNDDCTMDNDAGPNFLQNFPELGSPTYESDGTVTVPGLLKSYPYGSFAIDLYSVSSGDPNGHGEGQTLIGTVNVSTNGNGFAPFTFHSTLPISQSLAISATATDSFGNTSEFSCNAGVCAFSGLAPEGDVCPGALLVNLDGDQSDATYADGVCDINTSNSEPHECTLRAALEIVMNPNNVQFRTINFDIPGPGVHIINTTGLPAITSYVVIRGDSQPGYVDKPLIELRGSGPAAATGFLVQAAGITISGFAINNFFDHGIHISGGSDNRIQSCFIGVAADGTTPGPDLPSSTAIMIENGSHNTIGGSTVPAKNVIAHSFYGVYITGGQNNNVLNNRIGTDASGFEPRGNAYGLILIGTNGNQIGSKLDVDGNTISANDIGVKIGGNSENNTLAGNLIGTSVNGFFPLGNLTNGILIDSGAKNNNIGRSLSATGRNIISGQNSRNSSTGILLDSDAGINNTISGNNIGLNKEATNKIGNRTGIVVLADQQIIGGSNGGLYNAIAGNQEIGILVRPVAGSSNPEVNKTKITYNYIGTGRHNETDLGNGTFGIVLQDQVSATNIRGNIIGGNTFGGVFLVQTGPSTLGPNGNVILENKVGVNENADTTIPNPIGIFLKGATSNQIGRNTLSGNSIAGMLLGATGDLSGSPEFAGLDPKLANFISGKPVPGMTSLAPLDTALTIDNRVYDNRIGVDNAGGSPSGQSPIRNGAIGLFVGEYANNNCIGGCDPNVTEGGPGNTISGHIESVQSDNSVGLFLGSLGQSPDAAAKPRGNRIRDNIIGLDRSMQNCIPNWIGLAVSNAGENQIGEFTQHGPSGGQVRHGNVLACNAKNAIEIRNNEIGELKVGANFVGTTPNFGIPLEPGNGFGGIVILAERQRITRRIWVYANTVGNHTGSGIKVRTPGITPRAAARSQGGVPLIEISGNQIGVQADGNGGYSPIQNGVGIELDCVSGAYIGDFASSGAIKNVIAGNIGDGISVMGGDSSTVPCPDSGANVIADTIVGTDPDGSTNLGNGGNGIALHNTENNTIGMQNRGNTISGNFGNGVMIEGGGFNNFLNNNIGIAQNLVASEKVSNRLAGMKLLNTTSNVIFVLNKIAGNDGPGIQLQNAVETSIKNNRVGTDENNSPNLGNGGSGVVLSENSRLNIIGGREMGSGNVIANNAGAGVMVDETAGHCNLIDPNAIFGNTGLGIDLGSAGHMPNDAGDADTGPNNLQNYPQINLWQVDVNGDLLINYKVDSLAENSNYGASGIYVEFFESDLSGEGERFIGSNYWTLTDLANAGKVVNLGNAAALGIVQGDLITASATDADGNTSEFFPPFAPSAAGVTVGGRIVEPNGNPIGNAMLTLTDTTGHVRRARSSAFGRYQFEDVEVGQTYVVAVSHTRFAFTNPTRLITVVDELTDVDFTSDP